MPRRPSLALVGALSAALVAVVGVLPPPASAAAAPNPAATAIPPLTFLHVVTPTSGPDLTPYLADAAGREVLLRGAAAVGMEDVAYPNANGGPALFPVAPSAYAGRCPTPSALIPQPPLCEVQASLPAYSQSTTPGSGDDFAQMRALGFNVVRLVLNWSQLEPAAGTYSATYLNRVAQVVGWARQQGIYVILDMHQDQYSRYIVPARRGMAPSGCTPSGGGDGAPGWAVQADGKPACALFGIDELNPAESASFYNFWHNSTVAGPQGQAPGTGLQDHYIGALAALARRFAGTATVLGYELMNEPQPGSIGSTPAGNGYQASSQELYPFYARAIEAITGVRDGLPSCPATAPTSLTGSCAYPQLASVSHQQVFFEPLAYRNLVDFSLQVSAPFSSYPNLVFAPHVYTYAFTIAQELLGQPAKPGGFPPNFTFGYQTAESEAQAMHSAVFTTEFGDSAGTDPSILANELAAQESTQTGGTLWAWKGLSKTPVSCWCTLLAALALPDDRQRHTGEGQPLVGALLQRPPHREPPTTHDAGVAGGHRRAARRVRLRPRHPHLRHGGDVDLGRPTRRPADRHGALRALHGPGRGARERGGRPRRGRDPTRRQPGGLCDDDGPGRGVVVPVRHHRRTGFDRPGEPGHGRGRQSARADR